MPKVSFLKKSIKTPRGGVGAITKTVEQNPEIQKTDRTSFASEKWKEGEGPKGPGGQGQYTLYNIKRRGFLFSGPWPRIVALR